MAPPPTTASAEAAYAALYPTYAEICALSQLNKKPGFGAAISSGVGGHAVLWLNGVCRRQDVAYPVLQMCDAQGGQPSADGVGLSVNAHYQNAAWVAIEGRDLLFNGGLKPGEPLTRETYARVLAAAQRARIYDGVTFRDAVYDGMPAGFTREAFQYEVSAATDFAIKFGRERTCGRIPLSRAQMLALVAYLNEFNTPYRTGALVFDWDLFEHNCSHVNHNALAAAGFWDEWPMDRFVLISALDFPVPKNELVNAMRRANDLPIDDLDALFADEAARRLLLEHDRLPTEPGALLDFDTIASPNAVYETDPRLIFYDDPITGRYQQRFNAILTEPRYSRLRDNLAYFAQLYAKIERERKPLAGHKIAAKDRDQFAAFYGRYYAYIARQSELVARQIAQLDASPPAALRSPGAAARP